MKTLHGKLSFALLVLLCLTGIALLPFYLWTTRVYNAEVSQHLNRDLAAHLAAHLAQKGLLSADFASNPARQRQAEAEISHLMVLNPDIEIYCLDEAGRILSYSAAPGAVQRHQVSLEPVRRFLATAGPLPIVGDDPREPQGGKVFSVATIPQTQTAARLRGYVYIILAGEDHDNFAGTLRRSYILRLGAQGLVGGLFIVFAATTLLAFGLTRRLRRLSRAVEVFGDGNGNNNGNSNGDSGVLALPPPVFQGTPRDEVDTLERGFARMAQRIQAQVQKLEAADVFRREAVSNVSHDLRTPLAALQGYLETLLMKEPDLSPEERRAYLHTATRHSQRLSKLVMELFELAKLDSDESHLHLETIAFAELVQDVVMQFHHRAAQQEIQLEMCFEDGLPFVRGDIGLIERALENLLDNALRHTPQGGSVTVTLLAEADSGRIAVRIVDTGNGIGPEALPHIFERHYRGAPHGEETGGAGLGLAITKRITELHGGSVAAESTVGEGAKFTLSLPMVVDIPKN